MVDLNLMLKESLIIKKYLMSDLFRVKVASKSNYSTLFTDGEEHIYALSYNIVASLTSVIKYLKINYCSRYNLMLVRNIIENYVILEIFTHSKVDLTYIELFLDHYKVSNYLQSMLDINTNNSNNLNKDTIDEYKTAINKFVNTFEFYNEEAVKDIYNKRYGWAYSMIEAQKQSTINKIINRYASDDIIKLFKEVNVLTHNLNAEVISDDLDLITFFSKALELVSSSILNPEIDINEVLSLEINDDVYNIKDELCTDFNQNDLNSFYIKSKLLIEDICTKVYLLDANEHELYLYEMYYKIKLESSLVEKHKMLEEVMTKHNNVYDKSMDINFYRGKYLNKTFGFTLKGSKTINTSKFVSVMLEKICSKEEFELIYNYYDMTNSYTHASMYQYINSTKELSPDIFKWLIKHINTYIL